MLALIAANPLEHIVQHPLVTRPLNLDGWHIGKFSLGWLAPNHVITLMSDHIASLVLSCLLLALLLPVLVRKRRGGDEIGTLVPAPPANAVEAICEYLREEVARPTLHQYTDRFIKYLWTLFFFLLVANLLGLVPIAQISPLAGIHLGGSATGNIWVTGTMAIVTLGMMVVNGLRLGGLDYIKHFCPGPLWLAPILVPIELIGPVAKAFALAVRLFANMFAGHILLAVLVSFILSAGVAAGAGAGLAVAVPVVAGAVAISVLEIMVAFIQAFIFTFLTALFIGQSIVFHHTEHPEEHGEAHAV